MAAADVTGQANDQGQYHPMLEQAQENATATLDDEEAKKIELGRADAGYCNEADLERACDHEILMATKKDWKRRKELREEPPPRGRIPKNLSCGSGTGRTAACCPPEYGWYQAASRPRAGLPGKKYRS